MVKFKSTQTLLECNDAIIFSDHYKKKEWDDLDPEKKDFVIKNLNIFAEKMQNDMAIDMICHIINDLMKRIENLENGIRK